LRWYYDLDGIDDYITIPQVNLVAGDTVEFKIVAPSSAPSSWRAVLYGINSGSYRPNLEHSSTGFWWFDDDCTAITVDGTPIGHGVTPFPSDGIEHTVSVTIINSDSNTYINSIGANNTGGNSANFPIYDVDIQAASGDRFYAIDDGPGAIEIVDSISSENGTPVNFNDPRWYEGV